MAECEFKGSRRTGGGNASAFTEVINKMSLVSLLSIWMRLGYPSNGYIGPFFTLIALA
jgi:hypothetical protein